MNFYYKSFLIEKKKLKIIEYPVEEKSCLLGIFNEHICNEFIGIVKLIKISFLQFFSLLRRKATFEKFTVNVQRKNLKAKKRRNKGIAEIKSMNVVSGVVIFCDIVHILALKSFHTCIKLY